MCHTIDTKQVPSAMDGYLQALKQLNQHQVHYAAAAAAAAEKQTFAALVPTERRFGRASLQLSLVPLFVAAQAVDWRQGAQFLRAPTLALRTGRASISSLNCVSGARRRCPTLAELDSLPKLLPVPLPADQQRDCVHCSAGAEPGALQGSATRMGSTHQTFATDLQQGQRSDFTNFITHRDNKVVRHAPTQTSNAMSRSDLL